MYSGIDLFWEVGGAELPNCNRDRFTADVRDASRNASRDPSR